MAYNASQAVHLDKLTALKAKLDALLSQLVTQSDQSAIGAAWAPLKKELAEIVVSVDATFKTRYQELLVSIAGTFVMAARTIASLEIRIHDRILNTALEGFCFDESPLLLCFYFDESLILLGRPLKP